MQLVNQITNNAITYPRPNANHDQIDDRNCHKIKAENLDILKIGSRYFDTILLECKL